MIFGRKWYQIRAKSKAKGDWTVLRKTDLLAVLPTGYGKSLIYQLLICFLVDSLNIFQQAFIATDLPCVTFRFTWQTLQTSLQLLSFWAGFFSLFPTSDSLQILKFIFSRKTTKRKYDNALAPTDFVTKEVAWFWLDNLDSQTFHSWVGFA